MYVAVRRYEGVTNPSEAGRIVDEGFVPLISEIPGFIAYYWVDAGDGVMVSTSVLSIRTLRSRRTLWQESSCRRIYSPCCRTDPRSQRVRLWHTRRARRRADRSC
jgi:hypothetical protein